MSEQNPYAPVGTPVMAPPSAPGMIPPQGFAPPQPQGFAPPPAPAPVQYQSAGMALTELSFAPLPTDAPPAPVEPPPPAGQSLVTNVLPSGGVARSFSLGGRMPLIALVLVILLGAAGAAYATGLFGGKAEEEPLPVVKKAPVTAPSASAPAVVVPVVKPLVGKPLAVSKANSGTLGAAYSVTVPNGWVPRLKGGLEDDGNLDLTIAHKRTGQGFMLASLPATYVKGPLTPAIEEQLVTDFPVDDETAKVLPGSVKVTVAGTTANAFDATAEIDGVLVAMRVAAFSHGTTVYQAVWISSPEDFPTSVATFDSFLASVKFVK